MRWTRWIGMAAALALIGCAGADEENKSSGGDFSPGNNAATNNGGFGNATTNNQTPPVEQEFGFSQPAVVNGRVFVANTDLNTVAAINAENARISTIPVGFAPTRIVGPSTDVVGGSAFVLNEGASTVTVVGPELDTTTFDVGRNSNELAGAPDGSAAVAWYAVAPNVDVPGGDLSAVTLVTESGSFQIAVGFNVLDARFSSDSAKLLVTSADGVSVLDVTSVDDDGIAPPIPVLPAELEPIDPLQRETIVSPDGKYAIARVFGVDALVLTDLETSEQWVAELPEGPSDIDYVDGDDPLITANLQNRSELLVATIPDGFIAGSQLEPPTQTDPMMDAGSGMSDAGDTGFADTGFADTGFADAGIADAGTSTDAGGQSSWPETEGFEFVELEFSNLSFTRVDQTGTHAFIYSAATNDGRAVLLEIATLTQRQVPFEKGITRVESDGDGSTFVVIHDRVSSGAPGTGTPSDDQFIAESHGLSVLDVESGASRLTLTEEEPQQAALWSEGDTRILYVTFAPESPNEFDFEIEAKRAVATIDLRTFALDRTLLPSLPNGLGTIPSSGKVYISQIHPQGRITFIDVLDGRLRTVTGFQLNAGID